MNPMVPDLQIWATIFAAIAAAASAVAAIMAYCLSRRLAKRELVFEVTATPLPRYEDGSLLHYDCEIRFVVANKGPTPEIIKLIKINDGDIIDDDFLRSESARDNPHSSENAFSQTMPIPLSPSETLSIPIIVCAMWSKTPFDEGGEILFYTTAQKKPYRKVIPKIPTELYEPPPGR